MTTFEPPDTQPRRRRPPRIASAVVAAVIALFAVPAVFTYWDWFDPFLAEELNTFPTPEQTELVGTWRADGLLNRAYVTNDDIPAACESARQAVAAWDSREVSNPLSGFYPDQEQCLALFDRRSIWSLFQVRLVYVNAVSYATFDSSWAHVPGFGEDPSPVLPDGFQTAIVVSIGN